MYAKFMALPFIARRASIAITLTFVALISLQFEKGAISETVFFVSSAGVLWPIGILVPYLKFALWLCKVALRMQLYR